MNIGKFGILALFLILGALAAGAAFEDAGGTHTIEDEAILVDYNEATEVSVAASGVSFHSDVNVVDNFDNALDDSTDYTWHANNGSVEWFDTQATDAGQTVYISYAYDGQSDQTRDVAAVLELFLWVGGLGLVLAGGLVVAGWLSGIGGGR